MSKKIILIGPPGAGKTTLRKIYFEGESSKRLLEYSLEPTHGQDSIILDLQEKIGIFDLAGQENEVWLEMNKSSIFTDVAIIMIIVDITMPVEEIKNFSKRVIDKRNEFSPDAICYLLLHKIDLARQDELDKKRADIRVSLDEEKLVKVTFTSIKKEYFQKTFALFIDILKTCTSKNVANEKMDLTFYKHIIEFMYFIHEKFPISKEEIQSILRISDQTLHRILAILLKNNHITLKKIGINDIIRLTDHGIQYFTKIFENFSITDFKTVQYHLARSKINADVHKYPFLGFIVSSKEGMPMILAEVYEDFFEGFLQSENPEDFKDYQLIPMFISALEKFSSEINIKNLSGFNLEGTNVKVKTYNLDLVTITLLMNAEVNFKSLKEYVQDWFDKFVERHKNLIIKSVKTCDFTEVSQLDKEGIEWLETLNRKYSLLALNLNIFDLKETRKLFEKLDDMSFDANSLPTKLNKKIKKLKGRLIKASLVEDFYEIKEIAKQIKSINIKLQII